MKRSGIERRSGLRRTTRLRARSEATAEVYAEKRIALVERLTGRYPRCQAQVVCHGAPTVDVHELLSRARGGGIADLPDRAFLVVCRQCHTWITGHDAESQCRGLSLPSWAFNVYDDPYAIAAALRLRPGDPCPWRDDTRPCPATDERQRRDCKP